MRTSVVLTVLGASILVLSACNDEKTFVRVKSELRVEPETLDFGTIPAGAASTLALTVRNSGTDELKVCPPNGNISLSACKQGTTHVLPAESPVRAVLGGISEDGLWHVPAGASRQFLVQYTPVGEGAFTSTLVLAHDGSNGPSKDVSIMGSAVLPNLDVSPTALDFGQAAVAARKELQIALVNNIQFDQPVTLSLAGGTGGSQDFGLIGTDGNDVAFGTPLEVVVPGSSTLSVRVWFRPNDQGVRMDTIQVDYCTDCRKTVALSGTGTKPSFALLPGSLDFGMLDAGDSASRSFTVRNTGADPVTVLGVEREMGAGPDATPTPRIALPKVLAAGEELTVDVHFQSAAAGRYTGRIEVSTDAWDDPATQTDERIGYVGVTALSMGATLNALPPAVSFGTVAINQPTTQVVVLQNTGNAPLTIDSVQMTNNSSDLELVSPPTFPRTLQAGAEVQLSVRYTPSAGGQDSATIVVRSNDRAHATLSIPVNGTGALPNVCTVVVIPNPLTFGLVARGRAAQLPVHIRSAGAVGCNLSNLRVAGSPEIRATSGDVGSVTLAPGEEHVVQVTYWPTAYGNHNAQLTFQSDDPSQSTVIVPISGSSAPTSLVVVPPALDFNVVPINCRSPTRSITLYNTGATLITITDASLDPSSSAAFEMSPYFLPAHIPAGGSSTINFRYHPTAIGADNGVLFITSDAAPVPVAVPLSGQGDTNATVTDTFQQTPTPADVLFVIDDSGSMMEEQAGIGNNLASFLSFAQSQSLDYQIAVTTTDVDASGERGRFVGTTKIITPQTPFADLVFSDNVNRGTSGASVEQGFEGAYLALSDPLLSTTNAGFLRPDAMLAIIFVSDEEEQSPRTRAFYESYFQSLKGPGNAAMFVASAVVGTTNPSCSSPNGVADYAPRYMQLAQNTGGVVESICNSNWGQALANIGFSSFGLHRRFTLSSAPDASTIQVSVNNVNLPARTGSQDNWTYDANANAIVFPAATAPGAWATITISYSVACL